MIKKEQAVFTFQLARQNYDVSLRKYKQQSNFIEKIAISFVYDGWIYWCCGAITVLLIEKIFS